MFKLMGGGFGNLVRAVARTGEVQIKVKQKTRMKRTEHLLTLIIPHA
jgi:hypothetical protein